MSAYVFNDASHCLHSRLVTLSVHDGVYPVLPKGVFDWHYLQCVQLRFDIQHYKRLPNMAFFIYPFRTADDESDSDDSNKFEGDDHDDPPYGPFPSYRFDRFMAQHWERHRAQEHSEEVAQWASDSEVTSDLEVPPSHL